VEDEEEALFSGKEGSGSAVEEDDDEEIGFVVLDELEEEGGTDVVAPMKVVLAGTGVCGEGTCGVLLSNLCFKYWIRILFLSLVLYLSLMALLVFARHELQMYRGKNPYKSSPSCGEESWLL